MACSIVWLICAIRQRKQHKRSYLSILQTFTVNGNYVCRKIFDIWNLMTSFLVTMTRQNQFVLVHVWYCVLYSTVYIFNYGSRSSQSPSWYPPQSPPPPPHPHCHVPSLIFGTFHSFSLSEINDQENLCSFFFTLLSPFYTLHIFPLSHSPPPSLGYPFIPSSRTPPLPPPPLPCLHFSFSVFFLSFLYLL